MAIDHKIKEHYIKNPLEWGGEHFKQTMTAFWSTIHSLQGRKEGDQTEPITIRKIEVADLKDALSKGLNDFASCRTDVIFLCLIYPVLGLFLARVAFGYNMLPMIFPLASGFVLLGPIAAMGLYEMSRRREQNKDISWADAFGIIHSPAFGALVILSFLLVFIFLFWMFAAYLIYASTLGPQPPISAAAFLQDVFTTSAGWTMIVVGMTVGFLFAVLVLTISVVSFPLLIDRDVGFYGAIATSIRAVKANPKAMAIWGLVIAAGLAIGSLPLLIGLAVILPIFGHATWHLYRKLIPRETKQA